MEQRKKGVSMGGCCIMREKVIQLTSTPPNLRFTSAAVRRSTQQGRSTPSTAPKVRQNHYLSGLIHSLHSPRLLFFRFAFFFFSSLSLLFFFLCFSSSYHRSLSTSQQLLQCMKMVDSWYTSLLSNPSPSL